jgi:hypothetical protein
MTNQPSYRPRGHRRPVTIRLVVAAAAAGCAVAICACGSSGDGGFAVGATTAEGDASPAALSKCMRAHGLSTFPDPSNGSGGQGLNISGTPDGPTLTVNGITFSGPAFQKAQAACRRYLAPSAPLPKPTAARLAAMVQFAKCMRTHGVPSFADPPAATGGIVAGRRPGPHALSPGFRRALGLCGKLRLR